MWLAMLGIIRSTPFLVFVVSSVSCVLTYSITSQHYRSEMLEKEIEVAKVNLEVKEEWNAKLVQAFDQLHSVQRDLTDRSAELERLRNANARLQARAKAHPESVDKASVARCSELLSEGAELVAEGERLLLQHGAEHDALGAVVGNK